MKTKSSPQLRRYHRLKEQGLCVACGEVPPCEGLARCASCRVTRNKISMKQKDNRAQGVCRSCLVRKCRPNRSTCEKCAEHGRVKALEKYRGYRQEILRLYGGKCRCCGDRREKYLQLDHINNDGHVERKAIPVSVRGGRFYQYVLKQGYRDDLQLLCANCHNAKKYGGCTENEHPLNQNGMTP